MRRALPHFVPNRYPWRGEKEADKWLPTRHHLSSGTAIASRTRRKFRKLLIPKYQLLLFSFQLSFISWFRDTLSPSRGAVGHPLSTHSRQPHTLTERFPAHLGGKERLAATSRDSAWGQYLRPPSATHSWNMQPLRSMEARQEGQVLLLLAAGSNSCFLYKTHQNFVSMRNPSVQQFISFVSVRMGKSLHLAQTPSMQSPPTPHVRALQQQAQPTPTWLAGPHRQPHARHCPARADSSALAVQQALNCVQNYHMNVPHKEY